MIFGFLKNISHNLEVIPALVIVKNRSSSMYWVVKSSSLTSGKILYLNSNDAEDTSSGTNNGIVADLDSSSHFTLTRTGNTGNWDQVDKDGDNYIGYVFAEVPGFSRFGSYTGNNDSDGHFIYTGFRPALLWIKRTDSADNWAVYDEKRSDSGLNEQSGNRIDKHLRFDSSQSEVDQSATGLSFHSNGVKFHGSNGQVNGTGTYIYAAWAAAPFKYANAR